MSRPRTTVWFWTTARSRTATRPATTAGLSTTTTWPARPRPRTAARLRTAPRPPAAPRLRSARRPGRAAARTAAGTADPPPGLPGHRRPIPHRSPLLPPALPRSRNRSPSCARRMPATRRTAANRRTPRNRRTPCHRLRAPARRRLWSQRREFVPAPDAASGLAAAQEAAMEEDSWAGDLTAAQVSSATYWRRRLVALLIGIAVLTVLVWAISGVLHGSRPGQVQLDLTRPSWPVRAAPTGTRAATAPVSATPATPAGEATRLRGLPRSHGPGPRPAGPRRRAPEPGTPGCCPASSMC